MPYVVGCHLCTVPSLARLTPPRAGNPTRYYDGTRRLISGGRDPTGWRLPGHKLEAIIADILAGHLARETRDRRLLATPDLRDEAPLLRAARDLVLRLNSRDPETLRALLKNGELTQRKITLVLDPKALATALGVMTDDVAPDLLTVAAPVSLRPRGVEAKLLVGDPVPAPDPKLLRTLLNAHRWADALRSGTPLSEIARAAGHRPHHIRTRMVLAFLSPKIQRAILNGTQPPELCLERLVRPIVPPDWAEKERRYGFG